MKILLTGGAGYIGSHVLNLLGEQATKLLWLIIFQQEGKSPFFMGDMRILILRTYLG